MPDSGSDETKPLRLGGMALRNGLLVHGPTSWAVAIRDRDGSIATASGRKPRLRGPLAGLPGLRGVVRLGEAMIVIPLVKRALPEAKLPFAGVKVLAAMGATSVATTQLQRRGISPAASPLRRRSVEMAAATLSLVPPVVMLMAGETAAYHGAEHKTIGAYESGTEDHTKEHDRCGTHLTTSMFAARFAGSALLRRVVASPGPVAESALSLASMSAATEVFGWSERHPSSPVTRLLRLPGHKIQRHLGTREPTAEQLAVGQAALDAILLAECA